MELSHLHFYISFSFTCHKLSMFDTDCEYGCSPKSCKWKIITCWKFDSNIAVQAAIENPAELIGHSAVINGINNPCQFDQIRYRSAVINRVDYKYVWCTCFVISLGVIFVHVICNFLDCVIFISRTQTWTVYDLWRKVRY